jgi:hypothetical protein
MWRELHDARLTELTAVACNKCRREVAVGTGRMQQDTETSEWFVEYECPECGAVFEVWARPIDALVRRIARDHVEASGRASSAIVSGEIGGDAPPAPVHPPLAELQNPALLHLRETVSELAASLRQTFDFTVTAAGALTHVELPGTGSVRSLPVRRDADDRDVLAPLRDLVARADLEHAPETVGAGEHHVELAWHGGDAPLVRTLRWTQRGSARDFGGAADLTRGLVDLADGLWQLMRWVDAGGGPTWPVPGGSQVFPRPVDLLRRTRAARLAVTHDWNGGDPHTRTHELWASEVDGLTLRILRNEQPPALEETRAVRPPELPDLFARLAQLEPAGFREQIGFVRTANLLDRTHHQTLDWFDGERVHTTIFVFGSEGGLGVALGDVPPRPPEAAAFDLLAGLIAHI